MPKYRKKPVVIEAIQLRWDNWNDVCDFIEYPYFGGGCYVDNITGEEVPDGKTSDIIGVKIKTLKGVMLATQNDYIIKGVKGEFYPCKPDIFAATYEEVEEDTKNA